MDDHDHYLFNPRNLTLWVLQLLRYDIVSVDTFLNAWAYEANRIFRDRLVGAESQGQFDLMLRNAMIQSSMPMWRKRISFAECDAPDTAGDTLQLRECPPRSCHSALAATHVPQTIAARTSSRIGVAEVVQNSNPKEVCKTY